MLKHSPFSAMGRNKILLGGILIGLVVWLAEGMLHILVFDGQNAMEVLFPATLHELWMRSLVTGLFVGFGVYAQFIINKLHESRERYRSLFENAPDVIFLADVESGEILDANPAAARLLLRPREEIVGYHQSQLHAPGLGDDSKKLFIEHVEQIRQGKKVQPVEYVALRSDGTEVPVEIAAQLGHMEGRSTVQGFFRDLSERKKAQEELENAHERLTAVMDSLDALVYVADMETHELLFVNKFGRDIWGDVTGKNCWKTLQAGRSGPCEFCTNHALLDDHGRPSGVHRWEFKNTVDGQWYDCHDQAIQWTDGRLVRMEIASNITKRKQAEEELLQNKILLESSIESPKDMIILSLDRKYRYLYFNKIHAETMVHVYGTQPRIGECIFNLMQGKGDIDKLKTHYDRAMAGKSHVAIEEYGEGESRYYYEIRFSPIYDDKNEIVGVTAFAQNITERKRAEKEIHDLAKFPSEDPNPVMRIKNDKTVLYANDSAGTLLSDDHVKVGQKITGRWPKLIDEAFLSGHVKQDVETHQGNRVLSWTIVPLMDMDYINVYGTDITKRIQAEKRAKQQHTELAHISRLSTIGEMASGLAHELNQPLCAIQSCADLCLRTLDGAGIDDDRVEKNLRTIEAQAERAGSVIRRTRAFVKKRESARSTVHISSIVRETLALVDSEIRDNHVKVSLDLSEPIPPVLVDNVQIQQVLLNLVRNSIEAMAEAEEELRNLTIQTSQDSDDRIRVTVRDSGAGLTSDVQDHLFDPFFSTKPNGLGIGLSISHSIIDAHQGELWGRPSPEGGGSSFTFTLPILESKV